MRSLQKTLKFSIYVLPPSLARPTLPTVPEVAIPPRVFCSDLKRLFGWFRLFLRRLCSAEPDRQLHFHKNRNRRQKVRLLTQHDRISARAPTYTRSLHSCFVSPSLFAKRPNPSVALGAAGVVVSVWVRHKILRQLGFYRYFFDSQGGRPLTLARMLRVCRGTLAIVATDSEW